MKRWLNILIVVCVLLTTSSVKAGYIDPMDKFLHKKFIDIEDFCKIPTSVFLKCDDAEKIGLNREKLTDYLRLKVRNNFASIKFREYKNSLEYTKQTGCISIRVWVVGDSPVVYHIIAKFASFGDTGGYRYGSIAKREVLGYGSKDALPDTIRTSIGNMVEDLAILFYKVRGEL